MENIQKLREQIDTIDKEMLALLGKRFALSRNIGEIKKSQNMSVHDSHREDEVLGGLLSQANNQNLNKEAVQEIWRTIMDQTRKEEENV